MVAGLISPSYILEYMIPASPFLEKTDYHTVGSPGSGPESGGPESGGSGVRWVWAPRLPVSNNFSVETFLNNCAVNIHIKF